MLRFTPTFLNAVFQNMAASVIASSLGASPSGSVGTVESAYADATANSPIKLPTKQQQQYSQLQQQQQQQPSPRPSDSKEDCTSGGSAFVFSPLAFDSVDHRLSLYFDLVLFGDEEEFVYVLCADVVVSGRPPRKEGKTARCFVVYYGCFGKVF